MPTIAVILSGCGVADGSEIHEAVLTLLALDRLDVRYQCLAPNMIQRRVINHLTNQEDTHDKRNVLQEAARIARGNIKDIKTVDPQDYAAAIFPGGSGAALNLSDFALKGAGCTVQEDVLRFGQAMVKQQKPLGFICIAPAMIAQIVGSQVQMTIGNDAATKAVLEKMGNIHIDCTATNCVVDSEHKVVTTPAYMLAKSIREVEQGIDTLVRNLLKWVS